MWGLLFVTLTAGSQSYHPYVAAPRAVYQPTHFKITLEDLNVPHFGFKMKPLAD
jgi:hypothetical protein